MTAERAPSCIDPADHVGLVFMVAHRIAPAWNADPGELVAEGYFALERCTSRFDPHRGYTFSTYACRSIARAMLSQLRGSNDRNKPRKRPVAMDPKLIEANGRASSACPFDAAVKSEVRAAAHHLIADHDNPNEREVLMLMAKGVRMSDINRSLGASTSTVGQRTGRIFDTASNRAHTIADELGPYRPRFNRRRPEVTA